ncbi:MAG: geranylgeranyl reductase family protein [Pseudanabaenaceae cyanobacterium]
MRECIVVGAGPAGGSAAYHLAKRGRDVLVLEKEALPRYKPCGGGVSPAVQKWFDFDFSPAIANKISQIRYTWQMGDEFLAPLEGTEAVWMVRRDVFDYFLIQQAQRAGAALQTQTTVTALTWQNDRWTVHTDQGDFQALYLVGADGAKGTMAKLLGFRERRRRMGAALEVEVPLAEPDRLSAHFDFGSVVNGYLWNFPKADGYSIGAGTFRGSEEKQNLKEIAAAYACTFGVDISKIKKYGHPLCLWDGHQKLHTQNAILAGEAACVVDPFTAEGIRPALLTGMLAALAIDRALAGDRQALADYSHKVQTEWGEDMFWAQKLAAIFYRIPGIAYRIGVKRPASTRRMGQILCGELRYRDVAMAAIKRLTAGLVGS